MSGLVAAGAAEEVNVVCASSGGSSALYLATSLGHEDVAKRLVMAEEADVHFYHPTYERNILFAATEGGCEELANDLLLSGASPNTLPWRLGKIPPSRGRKAWV